MAEDIALSIVEVADDITLSIAEEAMPITLSISEVSDDIALSITEEATPITLSIAEEASSITLSITEYIPAREYWEADGTSTATGDWDLETFSLTAEDVIANDFELDLAGATYYGDKTTDGSWRQTRDGNDLVNQRRESGVWVTKGTTAAA